jgi:hypothetical protein
MAFWTVYLPTLTYIVAALPVCRPAEVINFPGSLLYHSSSPLINLIMYLSIESSSQIHKGRIGVVLNGRLRTLPV